MGRAESWQTLRGCLSKLHERVASIFTTTRAIIHEMMQSSKTKKMLAEMLKPDTEFRGYYSSARENAGGG